MDDNDLISMDKESHRVLFEAIDEIHRRVRNGCKSDLLALITLKGVGRVRAREMVNILGVTNVKDISSLTENDQFKLSDLRGWSMKLVKNIVNNASQVNKRRR
jgi:replicative superfamily II helicase